MNTLKACPLILVSALAMSSCGVTVMTLKAPESPELESELTMLTEHIIMDDAEPSLRYKDGSYHLKLKRELETWENMALGKIMESALMAEGFDSDPSFLKLRISEEDQEVLELLGLTKDQIIECRFRDAELGIVSSSYGDNEVYEIGAVVYMDDELPDLSYAMEANSEYGDLLGDAFQSLLETMNSLGPMTADYELFICDGSRELPLESSFQPMRSGQFLSAGIILSSMVSPYALPGSNNEEIRKGLQEFFTTEGLSEAFVSGLLFPVLSRDAEAYDFPGRKS